MHNSMTLINEIDAQYIANSIIMDIFSDYCILVEGETDEMFFSKFLDDSECHIEICNGKQNLIAALEIINSHTKKIKVIGIIDKDFDFIIAPQSPAPSNLLNTDFHDVEMMCINSDSFEYFASEYFSKTKLKNFLSEKKNITLREYLLSLTKPISELRIVSLKNNLNLAFKQTTTKTKELDFKKFICKDKFIFKGYDKLIETIKTYYNQGVELNSKDLESQIKTLDLREFDNYDVCKGHDLTKVIIIGILKKIGKTNSENITTEEIERSLRLSFSLMDFNKTKLKKQIDRIDQNLVRTHTAS